MYLGKMSKILLLALFAFILSACGGSSGGATGSDDSSGDDGQGATPNDGNGGSDRSDISLKLGIKTSDGFTDEQVQISAGVLVAGGEKAVLVNVVDSNNANALYANAVSIQFTSACVAEGKAEFTNEGKAIASAGSASVVYKDLGCGVFGGKDDTVTAAITAIGDDSVTGSATATGTITVAPPVAADVEYVGASSDLLRINIGTSSETTSNLQFKVVSEDALPIVSHPVRFSIVTQVGGASLSTDQSITNSEGIATVELKSGSIVGSVIVLAEIDVLDSDGSVQEGEFIRQESSEIVVQSGLPTQDNFLLTVPSFNNQTYDLVGSPVKITARLSDLWNRAVPDGTKVYFTSDKNGTIHNSPCTTVNGSCEVDWVSGRSDNYDDDYVVTITAWAAGESIIHDANGNKVWDIGESYSRFSEPYLDADDNFEYNSERDTYEDINKDGKFNDESEFAQVYRGAACSQNALDATPVEGSIEKHCDKWATIWKTVRFINSSGRESSVSLYHGTRIVNGQEVDIEIAPGGVIAVPTQTSIDIEIKDENGNMPPAGTSFVITAENGTVVSGGNITKVPSNQLIEPGSGFRFTMGLRADATPSTGDFIIQITSLDGSITETTFTIDDTPDAVGTPSEIGLGEIEFGTQNLKANESTSVSVNIIDTANSNTPYMSTASIDFSSNCLDLGLATFSKTRVETTTGTATTVYEDKGCGIIGGKSDTITATLIAEGAPSTSKSLTVLPVNVGTLRSVGLSSSELSLSAFGSDEKPNVSEALFKLEDKFGNAITNREVKFVLTGNTGGAQLSYDTAYTDTTGTVTARIFSGRLPGTVTIKAVVKTLDDDGEVDGERAAFSEEINIFSRLPVAGKLQLTASVSNPRAYDSPGETVEIFVRAKDRNNLRVDDGTVIRFLTDSNGEIEEQCTIDNGVCKVTWTSARTISDDDQITILARVLGEMKFTDANYNNLYDIGESFDSLSEAYLDANDNGVYNEGTEDYLFDENNDQELTVYSDPTTDKYRGIACSEEALADGHCAEMAYVWTSIPLVNSDGGQATITLLQDEVELPLNSQISVTGTESFVVDVKDPHGNLPPVGTTISLTTNNGEIVSGTTNFTVPNLYKAPESGYQVSFSIKEDGIPSDGQLIVSVISLDGSVTQNIYQLNDGIEVPDEEVELAIGKLDGSDFTLGEATLAIGNGATLSSNGSTTITADIVNRADGDARYTKLTDVTFTSLCAVQGKAEFTPATVQVTGKAISTYKDLGCTFDSSSAFLDEIQVNVVKTDDQGNVSEVLSTATANLNIATPEVDMIEFISATPSSISLKGLGKAAVLPESSTVNFRVVDKSGNPMPSRVVEFSLSHPLAGVELSQPSVASNAEGIASVQLQSGTSHGSVSVIAELADSDNIRTMSDSISVTTGLPTQKSMSLSVSKNNPRGWDVDGTPVTITARVTDQYGNWVPDDTNITFVAEGGSIESQCTTKDGNCDVEWTSQDYRPEDGIVTILARMEGVAYFQDLNQNGKFDVFNPPLEIDLGGVIKEVSHEPYETYGEAFLDANGDGEYNPHDFYQPVVDLDPSDGLIDFRWDGSVYNEQEIPLGFNNDHIYQDKSHFTKYQGVTCTDEAKAEGHCASTFYVRDQVQIIMSNGGEPYIEGPFAQIPGSEKFDTTSVPLCIDASYGLKKVAWRVSDSFERRNKLPASTSIEFVTEQTKINELSGTGPVPELVDIPSSPVQGDADHRYEYLNERGHLAWAEITRADTIDSNDGNLSLSVGTLSGTTYRSQLRVGVAGDNAPVYDDGVKVTSFDVSQGDVTVVMKLYDACNQGFDVGTNFIVTTSNGELSAAGDSQVNVRSAERLDITIEPGKVDANGYNEVRFTIGADGDSKIGGNALEISGPNGKIADYQIVD